MDSAKREDLIINIVLNVFLEISQIDPCYINPDCSLTGDLELNDEAIELITNNSIRKANLIFPEKVMPRSDSLREIVGVLLTLESKTLRKTA